MREDDSNWFSNWEDDLPSPDELTPLSSTLISPDLALAFDIQNPNATHSAAADAAANAGEGGNSGEEPARTLKRPRLVWTPQLHKRFVDAVTQLGIKNAVPKTIMQLMSVDGLTRENVASHLQKYRLYLKRMHGGGCSGGDSGTEHFVPYVPVAAPGLHHPRMEALASTGNRHAPVQALYQHHRQLDHFGLQANGQLEHAFLSRQAQMESGTGANGREVLTLFPNGHD